MRKNSFSTSRGKPYSRLRHITLFFSPFDIFCFSDSYTSVIRTSLSLIQSDKAIWDMATTVTFSCDGWWHGVLCQRWGPNIDCTGGISTFDSHSSQQMRKYVCLIWHSHTKLKRNAENDRHGTTDDRKMLCSNRKRVDRKTRTRTANIHIHSSHRLDRVTKRQSWMRKMCAMLYSSCFVCPSPYTRQHWRCRRLHTRKHRHWYRRRRHRHAFDLYQHSA